MIVDKLTPAACSARFAASFPRRQEMLNRIMALVQKRENGETK